MSVYYCDDLDKQLHIKIKQNLENTANLDAMWPVILSVSL